MNTLTISLIVLVASIAISFFYGLITKNYSTVDRLWSTLPGVYVLIWLPDYFNNPRFLIAAALVLLWCIRLSTNFGLKGGYKFSLKKGFIGEDYRWEVLRAKIPNRFLFEIFNLTFISGFQLILIFMFTLPLYYLGQVTGPLMNYEFILFAVFALLLTLELVADVQQFKFYNRRNKTPWSEQARYKLGFNTFGLWKFSRHPNYFCEISQWVVVYLYLHFSTGGFHWSGLGVAALIALFMGSTNFSEGITKLKYLRYKDWQKATTPWIPTVDVLFRFKARKEFFNSIKD